jgi:hypothetical protein
MMHMNVGHKDGTADVYLTKEPAKRHQFAWVDLNHPTDLDNYRDSGFTFVTRDAWTAERWHWVEKGESIGWNAEGKLRGLGGQYLMARPAELWLEEQIAKEAAQKPKNEANEDAIAYAERHGIAVENSRGEVLNKVRK